MEMTVATPALDLPAEPPRRTQAQLVVTPHPLTLEGQRVYADRAALLQPGETLGAFLARHDVHPGQQWVVTLGGVLVHEMDWQRVKPKHCYVIECRRVPEKDILRLVAIVALSYFTFGAGGIGGGSFLGLTGVSGQIAAGVAYLAGSAIINKLLAPKQLARTESSTSPTYSLTSGGRNQMRPFAPMALVLGEPYAVPDLGAQPHTFIKGGEQHLFQVFHCGINCADAHSLRIGQTALGNYANVSVLRSGMESGNSTFPALGGSVDTVAGALLTAPGGPGPAVLRTSSPGTVRLSVDLIASLYTVNSSGSFTTAQVDVSVEYRAVGASTWLPFTPAVAEIPAVTQVVPPRSSGQSGPDRPGYTRVITPAVPGTPAGVTRLTSASQQPLRTTVEIDVPAGQYQVQVQKRTADLNSTTGANAVEWTQLKSYQPDTGAYDGESRLAVQIQASGQLSGALDELNAVLRAKPMPYWNGSTWTTATSRATGLCNPGAQILLLARGIYSPTGRLLAGLGLPDDEINISSLQRFMVHCAARGFEFDLFMQDTTSISELLEVIAYAGMGEVGYPEGKLGAMFFAADEPVTGVVNMGNMSARSFEVDYDTLITADELEFQYLDRVKDNTWASLRMTAPGVTNPRATASTRLVGVSTQAHAAALLRFAMAQNVYQRKTVTAGMDLEYMTYRRGQVIALSHDLTQWGYGGRLLACELVNSVVRLTLDDTAPGTIPPGYTGRYIGLRLAGEEQMRVFPVKPFEGAGRVIELDAPWPGGLALPGSSLENPAHDTLWIYDFKAVPGQLLRVAAIQPNGSDGATLSLVPETPEFWNMVNTGVYTTPPNTSLLAAPPRVTSVYPSEQLARQGNTFYTELSLSFETEGNFSQAELWGAVGAGDQTPALRQLATGRSHSLTWRGGLDERWHLELRVYGDTRGSAPFRLIYDVVGLRAPPPAFDFVSANAQPDGTREFGFGYTTTVPPADWLGCSIRYSAGTVAAPVWDSMLPLQQASTHYTASPVELNAPLEGSWTFVFRSLDTSGNLGPMQLVYATLEKRRSGNTYQEIPNDPTWPGALINLVRVGAELEAADSTTWDTLPATWDAWTRWNMNPAPSGSYVTPGLDLETFLVGQVDATVDALGTVTVELSTSVDGSTWGAWVPASDVFAARWVRLRVTLTATLDAPVVLLRSLAWRVSAEVKREYLNDVNVAALTSPYRLGTGDVRAPIANSYAVIRQATATVQDGTGGVWSVVRVDKDTTIGPRFRFYLGAALADPPLVDFQLEGI
jgi:hypothetical protein